MSKPSDTELREMVERVLEQIPNLTWGSAEVALLEAALTRVRDETQQKRDEEWLEIVNGQIGHESNHPSGSAERADAVGIVLQAARSLFGLEDTDE